MERARLAALRWKLEKPDREAMIDVAHQIAREGESYPKDILELFATPLRQGMWIDPDALLSAVIAARDRELYLAAKPFLADWSRQIKLLAAQMPDAGIEEKLCDELWSCKPGNDDANPRRRCITKALRDHGTLGCLDALEGFLYELTPRISTAQVIADAAKGAPIPAEMAADQFLDALRRDVEIGYGQLLKDAIAAIRARHEPARNAWNVDKESASESRLFLSTREYVEKAEKRLASSELADALHATRNATEALLKEALKYVGVRTNAKGESVDGLLLGDLVTLVKANTKLPRWMLTHVDQIRGDTNTGSHDQQLPENDYLTPVIVRGVIDRYKILEAQLAKQLFER